MSRESCLFPLSIIDEEHRGIQRAIVNLIEAILLGSAAEKLAEAAKHALHVTKLHFAHEEALLRSIKFSGLKQHREDHAKMTVLLEQVAEALKSKESATALRSLREFRRLLLIHLQTEDESYREPVNQHAAEQGLAPLPQRIRHAIPER